MKKDRRNSVENKVNVKRYLVRFCRGRTVLSCVARCPICEQKKNYRSLERSIDRFSFSFDETYFRPEDRATVLRCFARDQAFFLRERNCTSDGNINIEIGDVTRNQIATLASIRIH